MIAKRYLALLTGVALATSTVVVPPFRARVQPGQSMPTAHSAIRSLASPRLLDL